jgi:hypothetical protein
MINRSKQIDTTIKHSHSAFFNHSRVTEMHRIILNYRIIAAAVRHILQMTTKKLYYCHHSDLTT